MNNLMHSLTWKVFSPYTNVNCVYNNAISGNEMLKYYLPTKFDDLQHNIVKDWYDKIF